MMILQAYVQIVFPGGQRIQVLRSNEQSDDAVTRKICLIYACSRYWERVDKYLFLRSVLGSELWRWLGILNFVCPLYHPIKERALTKTYSRIIYCLAEIKKTCKAEIVENEALYSLEIQDLPSFKTIPQISLPIQKFQKLR